MPHILLMEDDQLLALMIMKELEAGCHTVENVITATEAIESLTATPFDLVIADAFMRLNGKLVPDGGIRLIGHIRNLEISEFKKKLNSIPIIAISGGYSVEGGADILKLSQQVGADAALRKPIKPGRLLEAVDDLLELRQDSERVG